jgi:hypothetical protein
VIGFGESMGYQWVLSEATLCPGFLLEVGRRGDERDNPTRNQQIALDPLPPFRGQNYHSGSLTGKYSNEQRLGIERTDR